MILELRMIGLIEHFPFANQVSERRQQINFQADVIFAEIFNVRKLRDRDNRVTLVRIFAERMSILRFAETINEIRLSSTSRANTLYTCTGVHTLG